MAKRRLKKKYKTIIKVFILLVSLIILIFAIKETFNYYKIDNQKLKPLEISKNYYNISDFGYIRLSSDQDYNNNGKDDYLDYLEASKNFAKFNPKYKSDYYSSGYPEIEKEGVSADLIWYALQNAGYNLKDMIDQDIKNDIKGQIYNIAVRDSNIDFRRVFNQEIFLKRYAKVLDNDIYQVGNFMPGDILSFDDLSHIAIVSDKYTKEGIPYIIHNANNNQKQKEENILEKTGMELTGHYRFQYSNKIQELINSIGVKNE